MQPRPDACRTGRSHRCGPAAPACRTTARAQQRAFHCPSRAVRASSCACAVLPASHTRTVQAQARRRTEHSQTELDTAHDRGAELRLEAEPAAEPAEPDIDPCL